MSSDLTVVPGLSTNTPSSVNSRWLSTTYYTQNRAGLAGNILLGYIPDVTNISSVPWNFKQFVGTPQASLIEASLNVFTDNSVVFGFITRDLTKNPAVDGLVSVNQLECRHLAVRAAPRLPQPEPARILAAGHEGHDAARRQLGLHRSSPLVRRHHVLFRLPGASGRRHCPRSRSTPHSAGASYVFDASTSFDLNFNTLQYRWGQPPYEVDGTLSSGTFVVGEVATQAHTLATGVVNAYSSYSSSLFFGSVTGSPDNSHNWVGGVSGAVFAPSNRAHALRRARVSGLAVGPWLLPQRRSRGPVRQRAGHHDGGHVGGLDPVCLQHDRGHADPRQRHGVDEHGHGKRCHASRSARRVSKPR